MGAAELIFAVEVGFGAIESGRSVGRVRERRGRLSTRGIDCGESVDAFTGYQEKTTVESRRNNRGIRVGWGMSEGRREVLIGESPQGQFVTRLDGRALRLGD